MSDFYQELDFIYQTFSQTSPSNHSPPSDARQTRSNNPPSPSPSPLSPQQAPEVIEVEEYEDTDEAKYFRRVNFLPNDPEDPKNWSRPFKWYCTLLVAAACFVTGFNSSIITADLNGPAAAFGASAEVSLLAVSVFVAGFGLGPLVFAPLSEAYGRRIMYILTLAVAVVLIVPCAVSTNISTLLVCRSIGGVAFSAPMVFFAALLADLWSRQDIGIPMAVSSVSPFFGLSLGPLVGGYLSDAAGWRWLYWIQLVVSAALFTLICFTLPETCAPVILRRRTETLRQTAGSPEHVVTQDLDTTSLSQRLSFFLVRPFRFLARELIVLLISLHISVLYGQLYIFLVAFPIIYQEGKGYSASKTGLMFIPFAIGTILSGIVSAVCDKQYKIMAAKHKSNCPSSPPPAELRLIPMMLACWFLPIGLFIFAWTSYPKLSWAGPAMGGLSVTFSSITLYTSAVSYIVDSYRNQAASAIAAKTFLRCVWGAANILFAPRIYHRLGYQWASSLLGFISLACCAIPFIFWRYGAKIRERSSYAYGDSDDLFARKIQDIETVKSAITETAEAQLRTRKALRDVRQEW